MQQAQSRRAALAARYSLTRVLAQAGLSVGLVGLFAWLIALRLGEVDLVAVRAAVADVHVLQWSAALLATIVSFWAVGHYDAMVHRHFETGVPGPVARRAGVCAIAVSQMLGLGVITGSILRWRLLPGQTLALAGRVTLAVALSFLAGWAVVTALVVLALPAAPFKPAAAAILLVAVAAAALRLAAPGLTRPWPNLVSSGRLILLAAVDTLAAGAALFVLLPVEAALPLAAFLPAFLLAQGAGLVSGTPGGVGAFEVTFLTLLPPLQEEPLLAAILAWRVIYYAIPAILGAAHAARAPRSALSRLPDPDLSHRPPPPRQAEALVLHQGEHRQLPASGWVCGRTAHLLVGLFTPARSGRMALTELDRAATDCARLPVAYKCDARLAVQARRAGWMTLRIAREGWLDPRATDLTSPRCAGLRRKLRRAEAAGVTIACPATLPLAEMTALATHWAAAHGGERGFSMGRFAPDYIARQRVYLAYREGQVLAFVTMHALAHDWALDLMRHGPGVPDGTMHALVAAAIADATSAGVPRLSLAAVPEAAFGPVRWQDRLLRRLGCDGHGLLRFKQAFAPHWAPLYLAAPGPIPLCLAVFEIARAITQPARLRKDEQDHAEYEFASAGGPWQRQAE